MPCAGCSTPRGPDSGLYSGDPDPEAGPEDGGPALRIIPGRPPGRLRPGFRGVCLALRTEAGAGTAAGKRIKYESFPSFRPPRRRGVPFPPMGKEPKDRPGNLPNGSPGPLLPAKGGRMPPIGSPRICYLIPLFRAELPSPVLRLPLGFEGGGAPFVVGEGFQRGPPRNRSPLAVSFPTFFSGKESGPPEATRRKGRF